MLRDYIQKFLGQEYSLGSVDCFSIVYNYLTEIIELPISFEGLTLETYKDLYIINRELAINTMLRFFETYLTEIKLLDMRPGDIVILKYNQYPLFTGILVGSGEVFIVTQQKTLITPLHKYIIVRIFRCPV